MSPHFWECSPEKMQTSYMSTSYHWEVSEFLGIQPWMNKLCKLLLCKLYQHILQSAALRRCRPPACQLHTTGRCLSSWVSNPEWMNYANYYYCISYIITSFESIALRRCRPPACQLHTTGRCLSSWVSSLEWINHANYYYCVSDITSLGPCAHSLYSEVINHKKNQLSTQICSLRLYNKFNITKNQPENDP